jgi:uncharacterized protein YqeY
MLNQIKDDLKAALMAGDSLRTLVLRGLLSELNYRKIEVQRELNNDDVLAVVAKEVKKRKEAIESFKAGGRTEQANTEALELEILNSYAPVMMSEEEVRKEIGEMNLTGDMSSLMKVLAPKFKGKADLGLVSKIVKEVCQ